MKSRVIIRIGMVLSLCGFIYAFLMLPTLFEQFDQKKSINILAWPNLIDGEYFSEFEKKCGVKVYVSYFENYEELLVKMRSGMGDYDLVMASDHIVHQLVQEDVVQPLDKNRIPFLKEINPNLLNRYFDPENVYSIPYAWELSGIGVNLDYFKDVPPATLKLIFDPNISPSRLGLPDDAREMVSIASLYLYGPRKEALNSKELLEIKTLLKEQKKRVVMYTDLRPDYLLLSKAAPVVLGLSSDIYKATDQNKNCAFLVPKEGSFMIIDSFLLPKNSTKQELVYEFLCYLFDPEIMKKYMNRFNFFPTLQNMKLENATPEFHELPPLRFFSQTIPEPELRDLWIDLKS